MAGNGGIIGPPNTVTNGCAACATASGATDIYLAKTISVPADASLVVSDTPIYLRENDILKGGASATSDLELFITYEVIAV